MNFPWYLHVDHGTWGGTQRPKIVNQIITNSRLGRALIANKKAAGNKGLFCLDPLL